MEKKSSEKKYGVRKWAGGQWAVADGNTIVHVADTNEDHGAGSTSIRSISHGSANGKSASKPCRTRRRSRTLPGSGIDWDTGPVRATRGSDCGAVAIPLWPPASYPGAPILRKPALDLSDVV